LLGTDHLEHGLLIARLSLCGTNLAQELFFVRYFRKVNPFTARCPIRISWWDLGNGHKGDAAVAEARQTTAARGLKDVNSKRSESPIKIRE